MVRCRVRRCAQSYACPSFSSVLILSGFYNRPGYAKCVAPAEAVVEELPELVPGVDVVPEYEERKWVLAFGILVVGRELLVLSSD